MVALLILNSDADGPKEVLTEEFAGEVALGIQLGWEGAALPLKEAPQAFQQRLRILYRERGKNDAPDPAKAQARYTKR